MITSPFISARQLALALDADTPPALFDASFLLEKPAFDGDYRSGPASADWLEAHIPGSTYVDIARQFSDAEGSTHFTHPDPQAVADELARLGVTRERAVVVYDSTDTMFAARLWYLLRWIGVDARVLDGGLDAWRSAGLPVASGPEATPIPVEPWSAGPPRAAWVTKDELTARSDSDARPLVCGLPAASFTGEAASRYSRRGRIPGSVNVSSRDLFAADGTVRGERELREAYVAEGVTGDEEVLLYCGGGITATANALTLAELGVLAVRVYDGSLEEWSADPALPLALG